MPEFAEQDNLLKHLEQTLASDPANPTHHYNLGIFLWNRAEQSSHESAAAGEVDRLKAAAAEHFLAAAKLNPNDAVAFRFLGHHYAAIDAQRAAKCYQRAVTLSPDDAEAGEGLCNLLDVEGKESLELAVSKEAAERSPRAFWAFRRLGYLQVHQGKWSEAIQSLQHAIRGYPTCADLWEALGLAYHRLGMFTAAVKSYGRAIELEDSRIFAMIESGNIQLVLGYFRKGIEQFRSALEMAPHNLSANFGLASGLLGWSNHCVNSGAFAWGASLLEEALEAAKVCTSLSGNLSSVWKLHGDIQIAYAKCFPWEDGNSSKGLDEQLFRASVLEWRSTCLLAAYGGKCSYQRALHLSPWQANIYTDTAISLDLINSLEESNRLDTAVWELPEKMSLGGLMLEPINKEFWVTLGSLSSNQALKQHSFIRALQLDKYFSEAWAHLGKLYRHLGDKQLARLAFDHARSIDPSLALPWAGMAADNQSGGCSADESFESCLRAVQIMPLAEFQVGLGIIAACSGHLLLPQVLVAVTQAVQRAPYYPESHNINGLVCEARSDFPSAITFYRQARFVLHNVQNSKSDFRARSADISFNLARALCKAGLAIDAVHECEGLKTEGLLNVDGLQIYALSLWKLGRHEEVLSVAKSLAENVSSMNKECATAALELITTLEYSISGKDSAAAVIHKLPGQLMYSTRLKFIISALDALQPSKRFQLPPLSMPPRVTSYDVMSEVHSNIALGKMIGGESNKFLRVDGGLSYLKKTLHMYPDCHLIRNQLGSLLLCSGDWMAPHKALRITVLSNQHQACKGLKSPNQIQASATIACYATSSATPKFSFPTCEDQYMHENNVICRLQRWVHQHPWNRDACYLLVLNLLQKAREEKYPEHLCIILRRLVSQALANNSYTQENKLCQYEKLLLLLVSSEVSLQSGDIAACIAQAAEALGVLPSNSGLFFAHFQLCRAYVAQGDFLNARNEYMKCFETNTSSEIAWVMLKYLESRCSLDGTSNEIEMNLRACIQEKGSNSAKWAALFNLACAECFIWNQDYANAEQALARACAEKDADSCLLLCHGAICMEIARKHRAPQYISRAASSLRKAQQNSLVPLPVVSLLLAQAEGSVGSKTKWEKNLRLEWFAWPQEMRPAELYFQMHLLARQLTSVSNQHRGVEASQSPQRWVLRAIHLNPSCSRYWKVLLQLVA